MALETRLKENRRVVQVGDNDSKIKQHANRFVHDFDHATRIVDKVVFFTRLFLEA